MLFFLNVLKYEFKRMLKLLPSVLAGALALCFIVSFFIYSISNNFYGENKFNKFKIAISKPNNDYSVELMLNILKNTESVESLCEFIETSESEAYNMSKSGEVYGAIIIPNNFVYDIISGKNTPASIILPNTSFIETELLKSLADAFSRTLSAVQAGVYTVSNDYYQKNSSNITKTLENNINIEFIDYTLPREEYFIHNKVSATENLTVLQYYVSSGIVFIMLMIGMSMSKIILDENKSFYNKLNIYGINKTKLITIKTLCVFTFFIVMFLAILIVVKFFGLFEILNINSLKLINIIPVFLSFYGISFFIVLNYYIADSQIGGSLLLFISSVVTMFISGGFLPSVFLPDIFLKLSFFTPIYYFINLIGNMFLKEISGLNLMYFFFALILMYLFFIFTELIKNILVERKI